MKMRLLLGLGALWMAGCAGFTGPQSDRILAVRFKTDPLDHQKGEAIECLEITAYPASVYRIDKLPYDWDVSASIPSSFEITCQLGCGHQSSAISNIRELNDVVFLRVRAESRENLKVSARIFTTRGPEGAGRTVTLDSDQLILK